MASPAASRPSAAFASDTPPREDEAMDWGHDDLFSRGGDPDSMELLMMDADLVPTEAAFFHCRTDGDAAAAFHPRGYVAAGELDRVLKGQTPTPHLAGDTVRLFGHTFAATSLLQPDQQRVLCDGLFLQRLLLLDSLASSRTTSDRTWREAAEECRDFLAFVRHTAYNFASLDAQVGCSQGEDGESRRRSPIELFADMLHLLHLHFNALEAGKGNRRCRGVVGRGGSGDGFSFAASDEDSDAASSLFHLGLDWRWTLLSSLHLLSRRSSPAAAAALLPVFVRFYGRMPEDVVLDDAGPIGKLKHCVALHTMVSLADLCLDRFEHGGVSRTPSKMVHTAAFQCHCVRELWFMVMKVLQQDFWKLFRFFSIEARKPSSAENNAEEEAGSVKCEIKVMSPRLCVWWLCCHIIELVRYYPDGSLSTGKVSTNKTKMPLFTMEWQFVNELLAKTMEAPPDEADLRCVIALVSQTMSTLGGPNYLSLAKLMEHFLKRLENSFAIKQIGATLSVHQVQVLPLTLSDWRMRMEQHERSDKLSDDSSSFEIFLEALEKISLFSDEKVKQKHYFKLLGMIIRSLERRGLKELRQLGLFNLFRLIFGMAKGIAVLEEVKELEKFVNTVVGWFKSNTSPESEHRNKETTILLGLGVFALQTLTSRADATPIFETFMIRFNGVIQNFIKLSNDSNKLASQEAVKVYTDLVQEGIHLTRNEPGLLLKQSSLVSSFFVKYLDRCLPSEVDRLASSLVSLLSKMRRYFKGIDNLQTLSREETETLSRVEATQSAVWKYVYPALEQGLCKKPSTAGSTKVAELCTSLLMLLLDGGNSVSTSGRSVAEHSWETLLERFSCSPAVRPELSCQFLTNFLQQGGLEARRSRFSRLGGDFDDPTARGWVRCCVHAAVENGVSDDFAATLGHLTEEMIRSELFQDLDFGAAEVMLDEDDAFAERNVSFDDILSAVGKGCKVDHNLAEKYRPFLRRICEELPSQQAALQRIRTKPAGLYKLVGRLFESCSELLYSPQNRVNFLDMLLKMVLTFQGAGNIDVTFPSALLEAVRSLLPRVTLGLAKGGVQDDFVRRALKEIFVIYTMRFKAEENPFLNIFSGHFNALPKKRDLHSHFVSVLRLEYVGSNNNSFAKLKDASYRRQNIMKLIKLIADRFAKDNSDLLKLICDNFCAMAVEKWLTSGQSSDCHVTRPTYSNFLESVMKLNRDHRTRTGAPDSVVSPLETAIRNHFLFHHTEVFNLLNVVGMIDSSLLRRLLPAVEKCARDWDARRGSADASKKLSDLKKKMTLHA